MNFKKTVEGPKALAVLLILSVVVLMGAYNYHLYVQQVNKLEEKLNGVYSNQQLFIHLMELENEEGMETVREMIGETEEGRIEVNPPEDEDLSEENENGEENQENEE